MFSPSNIRFFPIVTFFMMSSRAAMSFNFRIICLGGAPIPEWALWTRCATSTLGLSGRLNICWSKLAVKTRGSFPVSFPSFTPTILKFWRLDRASRSRHLSVILASYPETRSRSSFILCIVSDMSVVVTSRSLIALFCFFEVRTSSNFLLRSSSTRLISSCKTVFTSSMRWCRISILTFQAE